MHLFFSQVTLANHIFTIPCQCLTVFLSSCHSRMPFDGIAETEVSSLAGILAKGGTLWKIQASCYRIMQIIFVIVRKSICGKNLKLKVCNGCMYTQCAVLVQFYKMVFMFFSTSTIIFLTIKPSDVKGRKPSDKSQDKEKDLKVLQKNI